MEPGSRCRRPSRRACSCTPRRSTTCTRLARSWPTRPCHAGCSWRRRSSRHWMSDCAPSTTSRRSGVVPPDVSAEAEGDDLCDVFLEQQAHLPWRRPHLPVSPLASSSPHPLPSSSILYRHPLLFSSSSPSRKEAVESGTGRAGTASLISLAGRRQR